MQLNWCLNDIIGLKYVMANERDLDVDVVHGKRRYMSIEDVHMPSSALAALHW